MRALSLVAVGPVQWLDRQLLEPRADERLAGFRRFAVEFLRVNVRVAAGLSVAHLVSLAAIAAGALIVSLARRRRPS